MPLPSKARVYADVNSQKSKDYWDYDSYNIQWGYIPFILFANTIIS